MANNNPLIGDDLDEEMTNFQTQDGYIEDEDATRVPIKPFSKSLQILRDDLFKKLEQSPILKSKLARQLEHPEKRVNIQNEISMKQTIFDKA